MDVYLGETVLHSRIWRQIQLRSPILHDRLSKFWPEMSNVKMRIFFTNAHSFNYDIRSLGVKCQNDVSQTISGLLSVAKKMCQKYRRELYIFSVHTNDARRVTLRLRYIVHTTFCSTGHPGLQPTRPVALAFAWKIGSVNFQERGAAATHAHFFCREIITRRIRVVSNINC